MFKYTVDQINKNLTIQLPKIIRFNKGFMFEINKLMYVVCNYPGILRITVRCDSNVNYDKMCKYYLINILDFLNKKKIKVYIGKKFNKAIREKVHQKQGENYESEIDISKLISNESLNYYSFIGTNT